MDWKLDGVIRDGQSVTADWQLVNQELIEGVSLHEVRSVTKEGGSLTEVFRRDWFEDDQVVDQVFQTHLYPGAVSAWHAHRLTIDRLFVSLGLVKIVLFDAIADSPSYGRLNVFRLGTRRPGLVVIPPGVWHGVQVLGSEAALLLNVVDHAYLYENPDHWRLPSDTDQIPHRWDGTDALMDQDR